MRWLSERSNSARDEIATTSLSASVGLGLRHPSAAPSLWLRRRAENDIFFEPPGGAHARCFGRVDDIAMAQECHIGSGPQEAHDGRHARGTNAARGRQCTERQTL